MSTFFENPSTAPLPETLSVSEEPGRFHRTLPHYQPTPLHDAAPIADRLSLRRVLVKDESHRFGMPSFKLLGASWAVARALVERLELDPATTPTLAELRSHAARLAPFALAAATDGNHGRAVARMAKLLGFSCHVFVPAGTASARRAAIESEGAHCTEVDGDYDAAVRRSAEEESASCLVVDDTSWPGYEDIPRWVIEGYATIFFEIARQTSEPIDAAFVPLGVGALGAAAVDYFKRQTKTRVIGVEPVSCASVQASLRAGAIETVRGPHPSMMVGLNCGTPSPLAFPTLAAGLDACIAIEDHFAEGSMRALAACGITSGETGAAALGGLHAVVEAGHSLRLDESSTVLVLSTEGATDPESYARIVGRAP